MKSRTNVAAGARECRLATPEQAKALCKSGGMGRWDIALVNGPAGWAQRGPGYNCDRKNETGNGIGHAICA